MKHFDAIIIGTGQAGPSLAEGGGEPGRSGEADGPGRG